MPLADGTEIAGYTIVRSLGAGGMGEVYLAQHPRLPRYDALKVLSTTVCADSEYRERFNREADIAATLWHQHIVEVHDRGDVDGQLWISMDYVEGTDAHRLLTESYPDGMPPDDVVRIITAVAGALDYAHDRGLLHRDVKPANILLANPGSDNERIMLADFGIARRIGDTTNLTGTNMTVGTVAYAAPEQLMGEGIDGRADQYALAATAFQLLTGTPPFQHTNPAVVISQHLTGDPPAIGSRRPELSDLGPAFTKALAKSPHDRYAKCIDFARALAHRTDVTISGSGLKWSGPGCGRHPPIGTDDGREVRDGSIGRQTRQARDRFQATTCAARGHRVSGARPRRRRLRGVRRGTAIALRRPNPRQPSSTSAACSCAAGDGRSAGGCRGRQLRDVRGSRPHRDRCTGVLRTSVGDRHHDLVDVSR